MKTLDCKRAYARAYYWEHREARKVYATKYTRTLKGKFKILKSTAKRRGVELSISLDEFCLLAIQPCFYCGEPLPEVGYGMDRVDNRIGYTLENCRPCCAICNIAKNDMSEGKFKEWVRKIYLKFLLEHPVGVKV